MDTLWYIAVTVMSVVGMEFMAWFTHKYVMHGFLWSWHEIHHKPQLKQSFFEKNDLFFLVFAVPSSLCYIIGSTFTSYKALFFVGIGISIYGLIYFFIHDVYIHKRFKWFRQSDTTYSKAIIRAHGAHHAIQDKHGNVSFGLLLINPKYFRTKKSND